MKIKLLLAACLISAALSCNKAETAAEKAGQTPVTFTAREAGLDIQAETKASELSSLTSFQVAAVTGTAGTAETHAWSETFTDKNADGSYLASSSEGRYWPSAGNPGWKFYASNATLSPTASGCTLNAANTSDIVCCFLANPSPRTANALSFEHIFAQLNNVTVNALSGYTITNVSITLTPLVSGTYNLYAGAGQSDGTGWSSTVAGSVETISRTDGLPGVQANYLWLIPGTYTVTASWRATKGDSVQDYVGKTQTVNLTGGKRNNLTTTLGGNAASLSFTVSVAPWTEQDTPVTFSTD